VSSDVAWSERTHVEGLILSTELEFVEAVLGLLDGKFELEVVAGSGIEKTK
jgi:hypothetical protein